MSGQREVPSIQVKKESCRIRLTRYSTKEPHKECRQKPRFSPTVSAFPPTIHKNSKRLREFPPDSFRKRFETEAWQIRKTTKMRQYCCRSVFLPPRNFRKTPSQSRRNTESQKRQTAKRLQKAEEKYRPTALRPMPEGRSSCSESYSDRSTLRTEHNLKSVRRADRVSEKRLPFRDKEWAPSIRQARQFPLLPNAMSRFLS